MQQKAKLVDFLVYIKAVDNVKEQLKKENTKKKEAMLVGQLPPEQLTPIDNQRDNYPDGQLLPEKSPS